MNDFRQELLAAFAAEHREHLDAIRAGLMAASAGEPYDLRDMFRRAHSLKGAARAVDLPAVEELAHRLEAVLSRVSEGGLALSAEVVAALRAGLDGVESQVASLDATGGAAPRPTAALGALDGVLGAKAGPGEAPRSGAAPAPPLPPTPTPTPTPALAPVHPAEVVTGPDYLRLRASQLDALSGAVHALAAGLQHRDSLQAGLAALEAELRGLRRGWEAARRGAGGPGAGGQQMAELDRALDRALRQATRLGREQRAAVAAEDASLAELRRQVERIALVSAETVLGGLGPMARDLAREAGTEALLRLEGLDLQADRRLLQALKDPVTHLLRNAVGHGLESDADRRRAGKPAAAEIGLRLRIRGGLLLLTVFDDGRGPDLARIEAVAVRQGLLPPRPADAPPPPADHLLSLVFEPGFSTAAAVDRLSGRGIGLSVVAEAARRLHGTARMRPRRPWGTEVELALPLSAARQPVLLVEVAGRIYGLPGHGVERLLRLRADGLEKVEGRSIARIGIEGRDVIAPVMALPLLLDQPALPIPIEADHIQAVLLRSGERRCALAVDRLWDVRELTVEGLDAPFDAGAASLLMGVALRDNAAPVPVLSPEALIGRWLREEGRLAAAGLSLAPQGPAPAAAATILVVDDSITTRTLEKSILEAQGYRVLLSVDGLDALNLLRGDAVPDLVVADVEMPRMDGFALLQAMRADRRLAAMPVILMTSRADPEDVRRGLELGANAYLTKQKFDQRELLSTIGQLL
ncbi:response regulator [Roseomonas sp. KE0001]|uniref:hybrid sensor histidine kinase/response regulator n=1 Tax=Roseomonas sp. KE0001 TaxID=2479201 RepID=UPI0018DF6247|nr:response regulator [Roseomonas sp. KE0001]MBI0434587.1 hybrid sensor histidine kinase/response regulator [Roseomonas sp. KE0001]